MDKREREEKGFAIVKMCAQYFAGFEFAGSETGLIEADIAKVTIFKRALIKDVARQVARREVAVNKNTVVIFSDWNLADGVFIEFHFLCIVKHEIFSWLCGKVVLCLFWDGKLI